jgi:integrase
MVDPKFSERPLSPSYVQRIYSPFRVSITKPIDDGILDASPCAGVRLPKRAKKPKTYMTPEESAELALRQDYRDAVDFMHETGLRPGELTGLHSHRIDRKRRVLTVAETYVFRAKKIRGWPKDKDARQVPLTARAWTLIVAWTAVIFGRAAGSSTCGPRSARTRWCSSPTWIGR